MSIIKLAIIYGGKSAEHEVSITSAQRILGAIDKEKYEITEILISQDGVWFINDHEVSPFEILQQFDVVYPVMHGPYGEDGTMQGLLRLADVAFVGSDVLGSAICMDKDMMKRLCRDAGIFVAPWVTLRKDDIVDIKKIETEFSYPVFIKPANMGSSVGVHKVNDRGELVSAVSDAFLYDNKVIIETTIIGKEVEVAVVGNEKPEISLPGYIQPTGYEFYTYESKYKDDNGYTLEIPAPFSNELITKIQKVALLAYKICECEVMARVDMFVQDNGLIVVNEINTIPGPNAFAKLWEASGMSYAELVDILIQLAIDRHKRDQRLKTTR